MKLKTGSSAHYLPSLSIPQNRFSLLHDVLFLLLPVSPPWYFEIWIIKSLNYGSGADGDGDASAYTDHGLIADEGLLPYKHSYSPRFHS